ncbi:MAG: HAD-IB family phosphatase [Chloroflexi bacterium]|nr:HAD-IB family phosphatase [Chloroflexota bacterium]MCY4246139.1 HAD-IB family phosphatase [Chloroflexota bacterium]
MRETWRGCDLIFFDCDSTLSKIEGIDELARLKGKAARVGLLTNKAMDGELDLADVYGKRLQAIRPTRAQLKAIEARYWEALVDDAPAVIAALHNLGKRVYIISGGLTDAVRGFGRRLGVPPEQIRAVELEYNELSGDWWRYHEPGAQQAKTYLAYDRGPLTISDGKARIIAELASGQTGRRMMIGDGSSDLAASGAVDVFVGFGGVVTRERVQTESELFLRSKSLAAVLALAGGWRGWRMTQGGRFEAVYRKGITQARDAGLLRFRDERRREQFIHEFKDFSC